MGGQLIEKFVLQNCTARKAKATGFAIALEPGGIGTGSGRPGPYFDAEYTYYEFEVEVFTPDRATSMSRLAGHAPPSHDLDRPLKKVGNTNLIGSTRPLATARRRAQNLQR